MIPIPPPVTDTEVPVPSMEKASAPAWPDALSTLRDRYRESRDLFSLREMAHLHFLRWLIRTGRLDPDGPDDQNPTQTDTGGLT